MTDLNTLTARYTSCKSFTELLTLTANGYVPSLVSAKSRKPTTASLEREQLAKALEAEGRKVWRGL
jgi:hypothetical protein